MRKTEEVLRTGTYTRMAECTCDLCGQSAPKGETFEGPSGAGEYAETAIELKTGYRYSDCGDTRIKFVDICRTCFEQELIPWLQSKGAVIQESSINW